MPCAYFLKIRFSGIRMSALKPRSITASLDLENMRFLNLKPPTTEIQHHTADIDEKRILIMDLTDDCAEIVGILNKELS